MRRKIPKKHLVLRCPRKLFEEIERVCDQNRLTRTRLITTALAAYVTRLGEEGELPPYPEYELPQPPRKRRNYYL